MFSFKLMIKESPMISGSIKIIYKGDNRVVIKPDKYDFDIHPYSSFVETLRNIETYSANLIHGKGTPYKIRFRGYNKIVRTYSNIKNIIL